MADSMTLQERKRLLTRSLMIDAARRCFADRGYPATTIEDIASAAGVSRATFYLHFTGKDLVAAEIVAEAEQLAEHGYRDLVRRLSVPGTPQRSVLRAWLVEWLDLWRRNAPLNHALLVAAALDPAIERALRNLDDHFAVILLEGTQGRSPAPDDRDRQRGHLLQTATRTTLAALSRHALPVDDDVAIDHLTDNWCAVLGLHD